MGSLYDVVGIGNAIVDVLARADDDFLRRHGIAKGSMTLIDERRAEELYAAMGPAVERSGGSAANTMAGLADLGGRAGFIGKVRDDQFGGVFAHDIRAVGVTFDNAPATAGPATARSLILITPDAERSMNTCLGISVQFGPEDLAGDLVEQAQVTYLEGYLWDAEPAKRAYIEAAERAHRAGRKVALSLSDPFCVERHRDSFRELVAGHVDLLFANEEELAALFQTDGYEAGLAKVETHCEIVALTRSDKGAVIAKGGERHHIAAQRIGPLVDTTGAGDLFAAGFLFGYTRGRPLADCGRLGALAAAEVISHVGPRPEQSLSELAARHGLSAA